jgi:hypothetical protein
MTELSAHTAIERFGALVAAPELTGELRLLQFDAVWRADPDARLLAERVDALIVRAMLTGAPLTVRRLVLYDLPSDEGGSDRHTAHTLAHRAVIERLSRHLHLLDMPRLGDRAPYRVRQWILSRVDRPDPMLKLADDFSLDAASDWSVAFDTLWEDPRAIENNLLPAGFPRGPDSDRAFSVDVWR